MDLSEISILNYSLDKQQAVSWSLKVLGIYWGCLEEVGSLMGCLFD